MTDENGHIKIKFAGETMLLDGESIIFLPEREILLVSDLHFEKGSYFATKRSLLPSYDTMETLQRLENVIARYQPKQIICMGDSFHDYKAGERISKDDEARLNALCHGACNWLWVLGNHDKNFPGNIKGDKCEEYKIGNINLSHEPTGAEFEIIGHYHPKARVSVEGHRISGRAFIYDKNLLVMPSFGAFTGGLYTDAKEITCLFKSKPKTYMIYNKKIWAIR